jgi:hypothetical protein
MFQKSQKSLYQSITEKNFHITGEKEVRLKSYLRLDEKQIEIFGTKGKRFGNIIWLAGGGASGKGFATKHFLEGSLYRVRDIDWYKNAMIELDKITKRYPEIRNLDLRNPDHVGKLHAFVSKKEIKNKTLTLLLKDLREKYLPNILFDITFQHMHKVIQGTQRLLELGYKPEDVNIVWVLTDYTVAVKQNKDPERGRIVPADILLASHTGAAINMHDLVTKGIKGFGRDVMDGEINVILGGRKHTVFWKDKDGNEIKTKPSAEAYRKIYGKEPPKDFMKPKPVIKDFKYLKVKEKGKPISSNEVIKKQLHSWIVGNIPPASNTAHIWKDDRDLLRMAMKKKTA